MQSPLHSKREASFAARALLPTPDRAVRPLLTLGLAALLWAALAPPAHAQDPTDALRLQPPSLSSTSARTSHGALSPGALADPTGDLDGIEGGPPLDPAMADPEGGGSSAQPSTRTRRIIRNGAYILYFYEHDPVDDETLLHILGLFWYRGKPDWKLFIALPLGAYWRWNDDPNRWGLISPLAWHVQDDDFTYTGAWLYHRYESRQTRFSTLFPLYWNHQDLDLDEDLHILGPLFYKTRPEGWSAGLAPIFWMGGGPESTSWTLLPLVHYEDDAESTRLYSPAFLHIHDKESDSLFGGIPALMTFWSGDDYSTFVMQFPLLFKYIEDDFRLTLAAVLLLGLEADDWRFGSVLPFFFGYEDDEDDFRLLLPVLYARWSDKRSDDHFGMLGPLYTWRDGQEHGAGLWPLIKFDQDDITGDATTMILPIYYASDEGEVQHRYFLPFLYGSSFFDEEHHWTTLGPLYTIDDGQDHYHGLAPFVHVHQNEEQQEELTIVAPLYGAYDDPQTHIRLLVPLLYFRHEDLALDTHLIIAGPSWYNRSVDDLSYGVAPFYIHWESEALEREFTLIPGLYYNNEGPGWSTTFVGPAFHKQDADGSMTGVLPLGLWHEDDLTQTRTLALAPGLYWSEGPERKRILIGPAWSFRDGETKSDGLFPIVARHEEADGSGFFFMPGFLDLRVTGEDGWDFTWLLSGFRYKSRDGVRTTMVAPLFLETSDERTGDYWALAAPWIYLSGNTRTYERFIFAPPFFYDRDLDETDWLLFPLAFGHDDRELSYWLAGPLAFKYEEKAPGGGKLLLGPLLFGQYTRGLNPDLGTPEALQGEPATDMGWLGPFVWSDTRERRFRMLFPLLLDWKDFEHDESFMAFFPLYFQWKQQVEGIQRRLDAYVPLYVRYSELMPDGTEESFHGLGPLFAYSGRSGYGLGAFPLFWHDRSTAEAGESGHDIVFPLVWHFFNEGEGTRSVVAGPVYSFKEPGEQSYGVIPLWFHKTAWSEAGEQGYDAVFPLYWYGFGRDEAGQEAATLLTPAGFYRREGESRYGLVLNYYFSREGEEATDFLFPLVYSHRDETEDTLFVAPLYYHTETPSYSARLLAPLYFHAEDRIEDTEVTLLFPYLGTKTPESEIDMVLPLFFQERTRDGDLFRLIAPLYLQLEDGVTGSQFVAAGPIWYSGDGAGGYDTGAFPLLWWGESADGKDGYFVGAPLFWRFTLNGGQDTWTVLTPLWHHEDEEGSAAGLFPLAWWGEGADGVDGHSVLAPVWWRFVSGGGRDRWTVLTPLWHHADEEGATSAGLFPLYWWREEANGVDGHSVFFPVWWRFVSDQGADQWTSLGPLWLHDHPEGWSAGLFPLAFAQRDGEDTRMGVFPFYYSNVEDVQTTVAFPLYFGRRWDDGAGSFDTILGLYWGWEDKEEEVSGQLLGPLYHFEDGEASTTGLFPLANWSHDPEEGDTGWLLPVAYYDRSADGADMRVVAGPAFYDRDEEGTDWGLAPLFWSFEREAASGSMLLPAYFYEGRDEGHTFISPVAYSRREGEVWNAWSLLYAGGGDAMGSWHTVLPLFYGRRSNDGSSFDIALPFYLNFKQPGGRSGGTVLFPLYWNFYNEDSGSDATVLFPLYWHFLNDKRELTLLLPWFHSQRKDIDRVTHGLVPLYYYSRDPSGYTFQLMGGIFGVDHTRAEDKTDYQLLWIPF